MAVTEELHVLAMVVRRLEAAGVPYMLTGSIAGNYYAVPRMTRDIDVVIEAADVDADRLCDVFEDDFYVDRDAVRDAVARRAAFNAIHTALVVKVDFIVRKDSEYRREEFRRRRRVTIDDIAVFIVAPEDLIISKLDWARDSRSEMQLADVRNLLASGSSLDREYLGRWVTRLGLDAVYQEVSG
jgi:predicted nucleotidyltransferase